ncbi:tRNA dihydrouridine synthase DusB, partial [Candidatus Woesearchaeota archaeon]|nr:tRNA dihydrouridine synthase DusB [Candidatus Woesearchaeota archaeon]
MVYFFMSYISDIKISNNLVLAPMAKVTNLGFRLLCKKYGAGLVYSEMINSNALARGNKATKKKSISTDRERPVVMQIYGQKPDLLIKAANSLNCDIIDLNLGCPDLSVMRMGAGAALLKRPKKIYDLVKSMVDNLDKPVTAKIRTGLSKNRINAVKISRQIEKAGACAIAVHGRNVAQKYSGKADWDIIKKVKESVNIPVIANGDIFDEESAESCLKTTNADFLMIGRAAIGEPYIFKRINYFFSTGKKLEKQSISQKIDDFFEYVRLSRKYGTIRYAEVKTHAQWFTKSIRKGSKIRKKLTKARNIES